ncbi:hypothetical protein F2P56_034180 [Juglans regia]|uniref:DUF4283 domain-containing protein n=1 Tax=Juglans regia TaxID=51240 RepID=A0A833WTT4_JUGRE|nr:hypothetical protein F2P56_034180 [Juglans regia]
MERAAKDLKFALVLKFLFARPSIDVLRRQIIQSWGLSEVPMISFMDNYHVLLHLANEKDYVHAWAREGRLVAGCQFRLFNWSVNFDVNKEPSIVPQWIYLQGLPLQLYRLDCLQSFANRFGKFLGTDNATLYRTRATGARLCVEVDLQKDPIEGFPLVVGQKQSWQKVIYEKRGFYCKKCCRQGHTKVVCRVGVMVKRKEGVRKEGEGLVWKEVGRKEIEVVEEEGQVLRIQGQGEVETPNEEVQGSLILSEKNKEVVTVVSEENNFIREEENLGLKNSEEEVECGNEPGSGFLSVQVEVGGCSRLVQENGDAKSMERGEVLMEDVMEMEGEEEGEVEKINDEVLSEGDVEVGMDHQKDYCSDPAFQDVERLRRWTGYLQFTNFCANVVDGGKLWLFWKDEMQVDVVGSSNQCLTILLTEHRSSLLLTFVYAKCSPIERRELWEQNQGISSFEVPWIVMGDFNVIRSDAKRVGGRPRLGSSMADFNGCIDGCRLLELRLEGGNFSWCNGHQGLARCWAKLDRVLINNIFADKYSEAKASLLKRNTSDHSPILLKLVANMERYGPVPFRFQNMWTSHVDFLNVVGGSWNEHIVADSGLCTLVGKLKRLKQRLRVWN